MKVLIDTSGQAFPRMREAAEADLVIMLDEANRPTVFKWRDGPVSEVDVHVIDSNSSIAAAPWAWKSRG